jgi:hypothetical protein
MSAKPVIPSRSETSDAAFRKLDANQRGYITPEDTQDLNGFDFNAADTNHDGRLSPEEFQRAWATFSGVPN